MYITSKSEVEQPESEVILDDTRALERVRELELELAQTKLAHVEAECRNQVREYLMFLKKKK